MSGERRFALIGASPRHDREETIDGDWTFSGINTFTNVGDTSFVGSVGIGTASPIEALDVVGNVRTDRLILSRGGAGVEEPYIEKTGNKGIGFFTQDTVKLDISVGGVFDFQAGNLITTGIIFAGGLTLTTGNLVAGTIDADFDALTATSYGGITEANLLDKAATETIPGAYDFTTGGATIDNNHLLQGYATGKSIVRSVRLRTQPGATPGTNINVNVLQGSRGYNEGTAINDATNLAKSGSSGDFELNAGGTILTYNRGSVVGILGVFTTIHDVNSSSTTELYYVDAQVVSGDVALLVFKRGSSSTIDWTTILDAGDLFEIGIAYVTSS